MSDIEAPKTDGLATGDVDRVLLAQTLQDFEVANARVVDLTRRLTSLDQKLRKSTTELQQARLANRKLRAELRTIKDSRAFRVATGASKVARAARSRLER